jgi:hypothetical protein
MVQGLQYIIPHRLGGIPVELLINYKKLILDIIKTNNLSPVSKLESVGPVTRSTTAKVIIDDPDPWWWKYGGMRAAHLHYAGEVYVLDEAQWKKFSTTVMADFATKLTKAKNISFSELVNLSDAVSEIA